ncbi:MAG TPA: hypothetical protein VGL95_00315 [Acetobacteraceae bacterium]
MSTVMIEIPVDEETAAALADPHRRRAVGELVKLMVRPTAGNDPLATLLETTRRAAAAAGLTDQDIDDELAAWKAERAASRN